MVPQVCLEEAAFRRRNAGVPKEERKELPREVLQRERLPQEAGVAAGTTAADRNDQQASCSEWASRSGAGNAGGCRRRLPRTGARTSEHGG